MAGKLIYEYEKMTINSDEDGISISGRFGLLALHRGLLEARFCMIANDPDVSSSPILSEIHRRVVEKIRKLEVNEKGSDSRWEKWLAIDPTRREWNVALKRASTSSIWSKLLHDERLRLIDDLLAPFHVDVDMKEEFALEVERLRKAKT